MPSRGLSLFPHLFHTLCFSQELVSVLWFSTLLPCYENSPQCLITTFCSPAHTLLCMKHSAESVLVLISKFCIINTMRVFQFIKKKKLLKVDSRLVYAFPTPAFLSIALPLFLWLSVHPTGTPGWGNKGITHPRQGMGQPDVRHVLKLELCICSKQTWHARGSVVITENGEHAREEQWKERLRWKEPSWLLANEEFSYTRLLPSENCRGAPPPSGSFIHHVARSKPSFWGLHSKHLISDAK